MKKRLGIGLLAMASAVVLWMNQAYFYSETHARHVAEGRFQHLCEEMHLRAGAYQAPIIRKLPGIGFKMVWNAEWKAKAEAQPALVGIWLDRAGGTEVYLGEEKE